VLPHIAADIVGSALPTLTDRSDGVLPVGWRRHNHTTSLRSDHDVIACPRAPDGCHLSTACC